MAEHDHGRLLKCLIFLLFVASGFSIRISNKTYIDINGNAACFRRFNATHQIGCHSKTKGNVGVVHHVTSEDDFEWIISKGGQGPYAALLYSVNFTAENVKRLWDSGNINGIMVIHVLENETLTPFPSGGFSPDKSCPNEQYGMYHGDSNYGNCKAAEWNPNGNNMMFWDYDFPIFVLTNETEVTEYLIKLCFEKYNKPAADGKAREFPLCAVELKDEMSGAVDSVTCMRRTNTKRNLNPPTYCDELGDYNVFGTFKNISNDESLPDNSVIVAAARIDSFSMFEDLYPSADNQVTGIVALLAAAEALGRPEVKVNIANNSNAKDILFSFFHGEAFDYMGSSRMLYEMEQNTFPRVAQNTQVTQHLINLDHISHFVEVNQLGYRYEDKLWLHSDPISRQNKNISDEIDVMINSMTGIAQKLSLKIDSANKSKPLPPASVQRFLMSKKIPAIVLTDHEIAYQNKYYNSRFDLAKTIQADVGNVTDPYNHVTEQAEKLTVVATTLAQTLYKLATGEDPPANITVEANTTSVTNMLYCMLIDRRCDLFQTVIKPSNNDNLMNAKTPYPFYVSVTSNMNWITDLIQRILIYYTGDKIDLSESNCVTNRNQAYNFTWMQGPEDADGKTRKGMCIRHTVSLSVASSPAWLIEDYDMKSGQYPTWTESSWQTGALSVRIFLLPSKRMETGILAVGVVLTLVSMLIIYFINSRALIIFHQPKFSRYYS